jgi:hypothetical protein
VHETLLARLGLLRSSVLGTDLTLEAVEQVEEAN